MPAAAPDILYCDCNATTPLDPVVLEAMLPFLGQHFGNPSSVHRLGRDARVALDDARERVAALLGCKPSELVFTSGGTESNNLAVLGAARRCRDRGRHLIASTIEHPAVLECLRALVASEGFTITWLPVDAQGRVNPEDVRRSLRPDTVLVSVMAANNEVGTLQPVREVGTCCREAGVLFHTDAVQWFGKLPVESIRDFNADLVSLCAHKFYGPKGAGLLYIRSPFQPEPILRGGAHENERRAGTENVPAILGLARALELFVRPPTFSESHLLQLTHTLANSLADIDGVAFPGLPTPRLPNTLAITVSGTDSLTLLAGLDLEGICASAGSACSSGALTPSHVLRAMGIRDDLAQSFVRFSLGRDATQSQVRRASAIFRSVVNQARGSTEPALEPPRADPKGRGQHGSVP